jgi:DNA-binding transcriptional MerR regulator
MMRSGTAARLAGIPVTTLRVWERRHAVVGPVRTDTGQRLYTSEDVQRLKLLRQLTQRGHGIGTIATQPLDQLRRLAADQTAGAINPLPHRLTVIAIGSGAAQRLKALEVCTIESEFIDLDAAEREFKAGAIRIDLMFVCLSSLRPETAQRILGLRDRLAAGALAVLYSFGTDGSAETLRAAGANVRREPISSRELARMITLASADSGLEAKRVEVTSRRIDDATLVELAELPTAIACECRRHVAEIVMKLVGFERYSRECTQGSPADAELHRRLTVLAASTRSMFEQALLQIVAEEGLAVPALSRSPA